jgi:putative membrane protein
MSNRRCFGVLMALFVVLFAVLAVSPREPATWAMENAVAVLFVIGLWVTRRWFRFSRSAYVMMFSFLALHEIGAHYTYSHVPYDQTVHTLFGFSPDAVMGWQRNQYDRVLHLLYGVLLVLPLSELCRERGGLRRVGAALFAFSLILASSLLYELIEWGAAVVLGDGSTAFLGTQGDPWDAQKDMALATVGALASLLIAALVRRIR